MRVDNRMDPAVVATRPYNAYLKAIFDPNRAAVNLRHITRVFLRPDLLISGK